MELFFMRLEKYIDIRPSAAMTDVIIKIMVEVLTILGIMTKDVAQGRTSMSFLVDFYIPNINVRAERYLKRLVGSMDVENALQRLEKLTQEEVRMAAAEALTISRDIDDTVKDVNKRLEGVNHMVKGVNHRVKGVNHLVKGVDRNVVSVVEGKLCFH
jgi:hypothetical protein